jgi:Na+-transporting NADH:ubiquinone oxidoreductase subunit NqrC
MTHPLSAELRQSATQAQAIDRSALLLAAADALDSLEDNSVYALENAALRNELLDLATRTAEHEPVLQLIAIGPRPDGTYNYCREACQKLAQKALGYE